MFEDHRFSKIEILIRQQRYSDAEKILSELLTEDPNNIRVLSLLAESHLLQNKFETAYRLIDSAIGLSPDVPYLFYIKTRIAIGQENFVEAERNINHAIKLDPYDADYFAIAANLQLRRKQFENALSLSDQALEIDPENLLALNTRSTTLIKLNRSEESFETIEGALREDPNSAFTHANYGWGLLEKGNHKKAMDHFKEALTNDPNYKYAQYGLLEALKASNPVYRLFLKYSFFMSKLTEKYQWGVIIGFYLGFRALRTIAEKNEALQPYLVPLIVVIALLAFSTWIISPISNLFLRFNKYGQLLLDKKQKLSSNFVAASLALFLVGLVLYLILSDQRMLTIAAFGFAMMLPLGSMFSPSKGKIGLLAYTIFLAVIGMLAIGLTFSGGELINGITFLFILGFVAFQWVANFISIEKDNV